MKKLIIEHSSQSKKLIKIPIKILQDWAFKVGHHINDIKLREEIDDE